MADNINLIESSIEQVGAYVESLFSDCALNTGASRLMSLSPVDSIGDYASETKLLTNDVCSFATQTQTLFANSSTGIETIRATFVAADQAAADQVQTQIG